jgi:predicted MPP superfamily phosphohydrolase
MKLLRSVVIAIVLFSIPAAAFAWKFASIADSRGSDNGVNTAVLKKVIDRINAEKVDLVIYEGDLVDARNDQDLATMLDGWKSLMSKLNCPYYVSYGNHDIPGATSEEVVRTKLPMPDNGPRG